MHVTIINFNLQEMTDEGYAEACGQLAPAFANVPGLLAKIWLRDPSSNTYGGVYLFEDRAAANAYAASELFATVRAFPHFANVTMRNFGVDDDSTRITQPGIAILGEAVGSR